MAATGLPYKRILVPYDGSAASEHGLQEAVGLATRFDARLRLLTVLDTFAPRRARMRLSVERARDAVAAHGVVNEVRLFDGMQGALVDFLARAAVEWPADLVVIGTPAERGFAHLIMGSDTDSVTRASPVPVLLVPRRHDAALAVVTPG